MSNRRQTSGEDYPDAALKHCDDARLLLSAKRPDGAAYLAGYAVECMLKTVIQVERGNSDPVKTWKHNLNDLSVEATSLAALPTNKTARYLTHPAVTAMPYSNPPIGWKEYLRYYPTGTIPPATAQVWVGEAERLYIEVIGELQKDGEL